MNDGLNRICSNSHPQQQQQQQHLDILIDSAGVVIIIVIVRDVTDSESESDRIRHFF